MRKFYTAYEKDLILSLKPEPSIPNTWNKYNKMIEEGLIVETTTNTGKHLWLTEKGLKAKDYIENESTNAIVLSMRITMASMIVATLSLVVAIVSIII